MREYGYLIVRNPGPNTEIIYGSLTGTSDDPRSAEDCVKEVESVQKEGDKVHYLTLYSKDEVDLITSQLTADDCAGDFVAREEVG
jgi:hypothetical protein